MKWKKHSDENEFSFFQLTSKDYFQIGVIFVYDDYEKIKI